MHNGMLYCENNMLHRMTGAVVTSTFNHDSKRYFIPFSVINYSKIRKEHTTFSIIKYSKIRKEHSTFSIIKYSKIRNILPTAEAMNTEAVCSSKMLVSTYKSTQCWNPEDQHQYTTSLQLLLPCFCICGTEKCKTTKLIIHILQKFVIRTRSLKQIYDKEKLLQK
jgi:hypothetical protein